VPSMGPSSIHLDLDEHTVTLDPPCQLDLGASAKALVADLIADDVAPSGGVVVELGGDVAVRGEGPEGPCDLGERRARPHGNEPARRAGPRRDRHVSTASRTWRVGEASSNHIVRSAYGTLCPGSLHDRDGHASDCVLANAFATAALLWNEDAATTSPRPAGRRVSLRRDGSVEFVGGWPEDGAAR